jgi:hypothetical protein
MIVEGKSNVVLIREFFSTGRHGRSVSISEVKLLTKEERDELGEMIRKLYE